MSLDWSVKNVKYFNENPDELWVKVYEGTVEEHSDVNVITKSIIFGTMAVGVGNLDWDKCPDFYARWKSLEEYDGLYLYAVQHESSIVKKYLTPQDVIRHMNLTTNVGFVNENDWCLRTIDNLRSRPNADTVKVGASELKKFIQTKKREFKDGAL